MYVKVTSGTLPSFLIRCRSGFNSTTACVLFFSFFWTLAGSPVPLEPYNICVAPVITISNPTDPPSDMPFSITCTQWTARFGQIFWANYLDGGLGPSSHTKSNSSLIINGYPVFMDFTDLTKYSFLDFFKEDKNIRDWFALRKKYNNRAIL